MKRSAILLCLALAASVSAAQEPVAPEGSADDGFSLIEKGARIILRSLLDSVEPKVQDLQEGLDQALSEMEPIVRDLLARIDDVRNYHPPEILPNGDIIIRRKAPAEIVAPPPDGEIEI